jgi:tRNA nucleotidyltransferase (CCA-adding enzyme)
MTFTNALNKAIAPQVLELCQRLHERGHRGWVVGGSVRDVLLSEIAERPSKPYDWDVATTATPEEVMRIFRRVIPTGIAHGTVTVLSGKLGIELTTLRGETTYSDGRHPDQVTFVQDIRADLARRDFTVNAIAFDPIDVKIEDPFDGLSDLRRNQLRAVGDPVQRFGEDGLRVLRAARFAASLEFTLEPSTRAAIRPSLTSYRKVSAERIHDEWLKSLKAREPSRAFNIMLTEGLLEITSPELALMSGCTQNRYHAYDVWEHSMRVLDNTAQNATLLRLAALLHDIGKPITRVHSEVTSDYTFHQHEVVGAKVADTLLKRLKFSNEDRQLVTHLVRHHLVVYEPTWSDSAVRRFVTRVGTEHWRDIIALAKADVLGKGQIVDNELKRLDELVERVENSIAKGAAFGISDLAVSGNDLLTYLKLSPGPVVGRLLRQLLERVLENPNQNQRERLLALAQEILESGQSQPKGSNSSEAP